MSRVGPITTIKPSQNASTPILIKFKKKPLKGSLKDHSEKTWKCDIQNIQTT